MAASSVIYTGNGSLSTFTFPFPYISTADVFVFVNGVSVPFTFSNASAVTCATTPASGTTVAIKRVTNKDSAPVNFTDGSVLLESDLDTLVLWSLYVAQESSDVATSIPVAAAGSVLGWNPTGTGLINLPAATGTSLISLMSSSGASLIGNTPAASIMATTVQAAITELGSKITTLDSGKQPNIGYTPLKVVTARNETASANSFAGSSGIFSLGGANPVTPLPYGSLIQVNNGDVNNQLYMSFNGPMYYRSGNNYTLAGIPWRTVWDSSSLTGVSQLANDSGYLTTTAGSRACKAWVNFSCTASGVVINSQFGISSITRTAAGCITVNFPAGTFVAANYVAIGMGMQNVGNEPVVIAEQLASTSAYSSKTATSVAMIIGDTNGTNSLDAFTCNLTFFGN